MAYTGRLLLRAFDIQKHFGAVKALKGVSFDLLAGEVHALVGENGAGKSTLIKVLTGAVQPDSGLVFFEDQAIEENSPAKARALGIGVIYQQPALFSRSERGGKHSAGTGKRCALETSELARAPRICCTSAGTDWREDQAGGDCRRPRHA